MNIRRSHAMPCRPDWRQGVAGRLRRQTHVLSGFHRPVTGVGGLLVDRLNAKRLSGSSVHGIVTATSALLRFAARRGVIEANPCRLLERGDKPSAKRNVEPRYLDREQIDLLLSKMGDEFRPVAACMAFAGLRVSEALALRWRDVDLDGAMLDVHGTKTKASTQPVPMIADLVAS